MRRSIPGALLTLGVAAVCGWTAERVATSPATADEVFRAIRANDVAALRKLVSTGAQQVRDKLDTTPLHYAALYGSVESTRILLDAGADANARNKAQNTPLIYAAYNFEKTKLLVEKGADVNAANSNQVRPLFVAESVHGNGATVRYLIEHGADVTARNSGGTDYLQHAAQMSEPDIVRLMLEKGLDPHRSNIAGANALSYAVAHDEDGSAKMLIDAGSDVNVATLDAGSVKNGPIALTQMTPLMRAAVASTPSVVSELIAKGASVNAADVRHMTPLMYAVASERANIEIVRRLIAAGADLGVQDVYGATALDWARRFGDPEIVTALEKAGAPGHEVAPAPVRATDYKPTPREAINRASTLLAASSAKFFVAGGGCVGCHHQPMAARAFAVLRECGLQPDARLRQPLIDGMIAERPILLSRMPALAGGGGGIDTVMQALVAMAELGEPASPTSDAIVHYVALSQLPSGQWGLAGQGRPPLEDFDISRTMMAI